ncbi:MAG: tetratricopeptide repeat protein, partial [Planctomycetia bacterium]|nr:tetratricopeptide repeat protein [Planctomycetia bacterium]
SMRVSWSSRVFVAWALLWLHSGGPSPAGSAHDARGEALRLYEAGRFEEALPLFDEVLRHKPRDLESLNKRGCILLRKNQPLRALVDFDAATRTSPFLAYDAMEMGRQFAPDVHTRPPASLYAPFYSYPSAFTNRGIALVMLGRDDEALASFRRAISVHLSQWPPDRSGLASAYCGLGQVHHRKGDDARALGAFGQAILNNPGGPNGHVGRGEALLGLGQLDKALVSYNEAIRLDPNAATARRARAALLSRIGRNAEAVPDLDAAVHLDPESASAYKDRGGVYNRLGDHASALRDLDAAIRLDPGNSRAYQNRAAAYNGLGRYERAVRDCDEAIRLDPKNAGALNNRGLAYAALGRNERALADLSESIRLDPNQVPAYHNRGGARTHLGMFEEAAADYEVVLRRDPGFAPAETGLRRVRELSRRRSGSARDDLAVLQDPGEGRRHLELGNHLRGSGDWPGAIAEYTRALEADPKDADALAFRGWSRACLGDPAAGSDARSWLDLKGWRDPFAPYMALLGLLSERRAGREQAASVYLDEAMANTRPPDWPSLLFRYLRRTMTSMDLLAAADAPGKLTEARAVIGLDLLHRGESDAGLEHLRWVRDHGLDRSIARDLARESLRRAESAPPAR